jgi:hypothetical protein
MSPLPRAAEIPGERPGWLAEDAVHIGPVSTLNSLIAGKSTGKFCRIRPRALDFDIYSAWNVNVLRPNSYATEQGIILREQGNLFQEQGIFGWALGRAAGLERGSQFLPSRVAILAARERNLISTSKPARSTFGQRDRAITG